MSAEVLREAAALMRSRAEAATPGPWGTYETQSTQGISRLRPATRQQPGRIVWRIDYNAALSPDVEHIASWHPAVALAVADWLDIMADPHAEGYRGPALAVAVAYLGSAS